jgi:hypothetical protein
MPAAVFHVNTYCVAITLSPEYIGAIAILREGTLFVLSIRLMQIVFANYLQATTALSFKISTTPIHLSLRTFIFLE